MRTLGKRLPAGVSRLGGSTVASVSSHPAAVSEVLASRHLSGDRWRRPLREDAAMAADRHDVYPRHDALGRRWGAAASTF